MIGDDRINDANHLSSAIEVNLENRHRQILSAKFGVMNYFATPQVRMPENEVSADVYARTRSPYVASISYYPNHKLSVTTNLTLDLHKKIENNRQLTLQYNLGHNNILAGTYTYNQRNNRQEFMNFSIIKEINQTVNLIAAYKKDLRGNITLSKILGLEFTNCCWLARLIAYEITNPYYSIIEGYDIPTVTNSQTAKGISFEIVLKKLGSLPNINYLDNNIDNIIINIKEILNKNVTGYKHHSQLYNQ